MSYGSSSSIELVSKSLTSSSFERTLSNFSDEVNVDHQSEKIDVITPSLAAALDRTKTSDRNATFILSAAATSFGVKLDDSIISPSTIRRKRMKIRNDFDTEIKSTLQVAENLIVHWDSKILPEVTGVKTADRLPVVVTGLNTEHLLGAPKLDEGTAIKQATAVVEALDEWNLKDRIRGMCFDTASVNSGNNNFVNIRDLI